ncbi:MAG TPA: alpha/beta hydrolase [Gemmatales bacterium]|nr:alpha/beta hydrolase [Gemmatales bacterium]
MATLFLILSYCPSAVQADEPKAVTTKSIEGYWLGTLKLGALDMRLGYRIKLKDDGTLTATGDSIDQGTKDIPIQTVTFVGNTLTLKMPDMHAVYIGKLQPDGNTIKGELEKGTKLPLDLHRQNTPVVLVRPQTPVKPFPYVEEELTFPSKANGVTLAGTFTKPTGPGPFAAVILISGSGPQDRDESVMGHKPFLVLSDHLTRKGIAVLRYDDRGTAKSSGVYESATTKDFADDTRGAVAYLRARKDVGKIGLIGHSEGGIIAPIVATETSDVAFIVLLAGSGIPGDALIIRQGELIARAMGVNDLAIASQKTIQQKLFAIVKDVNEDTRKTSIFALEKDLSEPMKTALRSQMKLITSPWYMYFLSYDPRPSLRKVKCPVLALNGDKDLQVPAVENLSEIEKAIRAGGNKDVTIKELPGLNHLFQPTKTGLLQEYGKIETTFDPATLDTISEWIARHAGENEKP